MLGKNIYIATEVTKVLEERLRDLGLFSLKKEGSGRTLLMGMNV